MKVSIGHRLFVAVLLSMIAVAAIGLELARWSLFDNFADGPVSLESARTDALLDALSARYREHHDWSFLPVDAQQRKTWLRDEWLRVQQDQRAKPGDAKIGATPPSPTLGYRIGLLDPDQHYLAGAIANPAMVAFASIDQFGKSIVVDGKTVGQLVVARPQNPDDELAVAFLIQQQRTLFIVALTGLLLSALAAAFLSRHFRRPIRQLVEGTRQLGRAHFATRLSIRRSDEFGELAVTFNRLAARLDDIERSRQQWIADTSHELRTPLSVLRGQMEALQDGVRTATAENIALMLRQILSLTKLVDELYEFARSDVGQLHYEKTSADVWPLVEDAVAGFATKFRSAGLAATVGVSPARSTVFCDVERLRQVLTNLLENCLRYTSAGGRIEVNGNLVGNELHLVIDDTAPGVPAPSLARLGERFFRVEASRNRAFGGAGLGLALSKQILAAHEGRLEFAASPLGGLRATIVLKLEGAA